jgi:RNA polymerase sigma-70 factor (ECF subfamily)
MSIASGGGLDVNEELPSRLDEISTRWTVLRRAHGEAGSGEVSEWRNALALRYYAAVRRYLGGVLRDDDAADEVSQEVMARILEGRLSAATPERGRFRDFLKGVMRNAARAHQYRGRRGRVGGSEEVVEGAVDDEPDGGESSGWEGEWKRTVLEAAWSGLAAYEQQHAGNVFHTVLRLRVEHPDDDSGALAGRLSKAAGRKFAAAAARQQLHRAREQFAEMVIDEVARGLSEPTPQAIREELTELGLASYLGDLVPSGVEAG